MSDVFGALGRSSQVHNVDKYCHARTRAGRAGNVSGLSQAGLLAVGLNIHKKKIQKICPASSALLLPVYCTFIDVFDINIFNVSHVLPLQCRPAFSLIFPSVSTKPEPDLMYLVCVATVVRSGQCYCLLPAEMPACYCIC